MYAKKMAPGEEHYTYTTIFDYGQYRHGVEAAPGVAFETTPYERNRVSALENHTLARTALPDGRVAYDEFYGDNHRVRYILRDGIAHGERSEEHTSELQSLMRISYAVFCLKKKQKKHQTNSLKQKLQ